MKFLPLLALLVASLLGSCHLNLPNRTEKEQEMTKAERIELYRTTATYLYDDGSLLRAQDQAVKVLELDPDHEAMRRMIGWIRLRIGKVQDLLIAEEFFRDLVDDGDDNQSTILGLATTLERLGSAYEAAAGRIARGEQEPTDGRDPEASAAALERQCRKLWDESLALYASTLTNGEGSLTAMNGLQRVHALKGEYRESLTWSERLIESAAAERAAWRRMLTQANLSREQELLFRENERSAQGLEQETHLFAASILHRIGRTQEAIAHLDAVVESDPELAQAYSRRAQLLIQAGQHQKALADLDRFLGLSDASNEHPDVQRAFDMRSECMAALGTSGRG